LFIRYQTVRNFAILFLVGAIGATYYLVNRPSLETTPLPLLESRIESNILPQESPATNQSIAATNTSLKQDGILPESVPSSIPGNKTAPLAVQPSSPNKLIQAEVTELSVDTKKVDAIPASTPSSGKDLSKSDQLLDAAMRIANASSNSKTGEDVLGASSPWKLNLYDDDGDGHWDRGKLDTNRDGVDDEKWNFLHGRWEKEGGAFVWIENRWKSSADKEPIASVAPKKLSDAESINLKRYRDAISIASSLAVKGKGKDVLGQNCPWKLNLYDDDNDNRWERGKLVYNRDDIDDENWVFKQGRWEKDGGSNIWNGEVWVANKQ